MGVSEATNDEALLQAARAGDGQAFLELFRRHCETTWRVAHAVALSGDDAVSAVVEAFVGLADPGPGPGVTCRVRLAAGARDAALDRIRRRRGTGSAVETSPDGPAPPGVDLWARLREVVPPPPPELWAIVQVAWEDRLPHEGDDPPLARRVVDRLR